MNIWEIVRVAVDLIHAPLAYVIVVVAAQAVLLKKDWEPAKRLVPAAVAALVMINTLVFGCPLTRASVFCRKMINPDYVGSPPPSMIDEYHHIHPLLGIPIFLALCGLFSFLYYKVLNQAFAKAA